MKKTKIQEAAEAILDFPELMEHCDPHYKVYLGRVIVSEDSSDTSLAVYFHSPDDINDQVLLCVSSTAVRKFTNEADGNVYRTRRLRATSRFTNGDREREIEDTDKAENQIAFWATLERHLKTLVVDRFPAPWDDLVESAADVKARAEQALHRSFQSTCSRAITDLRKGLRVHQSRDLPIALLPNVPEGNYQIEFWDYGGREKRVYRVNAHGSWANFVRIT